MNKSYIEYFCNEVITAMNDLEDTLDNLTTDVANVSEDDDSIEAIALENALNDLYTSGLIEKVVQAATRLLKQYK